MTPELQDTAKTLELCSRPAIIIYMVLAARGGYAQKQELVAVWAGYSPSITAKSLRELELRELIILKSTGRESKHGRQIEVLIK